MKKVLILGSNSFSGSSFVNHLLNKKTFKIVGISRSNELKYYFSPYFKNKNLNNFNFYKLDINRNLKKIIDLIKEFKPEYIINYSAQSMVGESWNTPIDWYNTKVLGTIYLIENLKKIDF